VSKALLKSKEMTVTDGLERSMFVMALSREIIASHGEPIGQNANWSEKIELSYQVTYQVRLHLKVSSDEALKLGGLCVRVEAFLLFSNAL